MEDIATYTAGISELVSDSIGGMSAAMHVFFGGIEGDIAVVRQALNKLSDVVTLHIDTESLRDVQNEADTLGQMLAVPDAAQSNSMTYDSISSNQTDMSANTDGGATGASSALAQLGDSDDNDAIMQNMLDMLGAIADAMDNVGSLLDELPSELSVIADTVSDMAGTFDRLSESVAGSAEKLSTLAEKGKEGKSAFKEFAETLDSVNHIVEFAKTLNELFKDSEIAVSIAEGIETVATVALDVALMAIPFVAIAVAVGALASAFSSLGSSTKDVTVPDINAPNTKLTDKEMAQALDTSHNELVHDKPHYADETKGDKVFNVYTPVADNTNEVEHFNSTSSMTASNHEHTDKVGAVFFTAADNSATEQNTTSNEGKKGKKNKGKKSPSSTASDAIVGGGQKVVNINYNAPLYKVDHQSFQTVKDAINDFEPKIKEAMLEILSSVPGIQ